MKAILVILLVVLGGCDAVSQNVGKAVSNTVGRNIFISGNSLAKGYWDNAYIYTGAFGKTTNINGYRVSWSINGKKTEAYDEVTVPTSSISIRYR